MDAYDIFKKLTKGLKFKTNIFNVQSTKKPSQTIKEEDIKDNITVKTEPDDNENGFDHIESAQESSAEDEQLSNGGESDQELHDSEQNISEFEMIEGVRTGQKKKKKIKEKSEDLKKKLELEKHNCFRNKNGIKTVGRAVPPALEDYASLCVRYNVSDKLVSRVNKCGYIEPTPIQRQAVPCMLENRQILACAPTGSGKTAAFLLPLLHTLGGPQGGPRALLLCPTRELAKQIYAEALRLSEGTRLRCCIVSKISENKMAERQAAIKKSDIVISTPNRLCYLLNKENSTVVLDKIKWLIVDEADKLFEGSPEQESDFRQQMEQILVACSSKDRRVAMFSATQTPAVAKWCRHHLRGLINITVGQRNAATDLVEQQLLFCGNESGKLLAFRQLVQQGLKPPVLVFVQSKDRAKQLFKELIYDGINVDVIHADRTQTQRDNVVRSFRLGKIWVLICTELMGRGIDFRGVNLVLNYDFPPSAISYIHRIGRAGRAGLKGKAITFFTHDDVVNLRSIAAVMKQSGCDVPDYMLKLKQNPNARKRLAHRATKRDKISTKLEHPRRKNNHEKSKVDKNVENPNEKKKKSNNEFSKVVVGKKRKLDKSSDSQKIKKNKINKKIVSK